jgi:hypothetical protein
LEDKLRGKAEIGVVGEVDERRLETANVERWRRIDEI